MRLVAKCTDCGFDNPRRWEICARCGALLGPQMRRRESELTPTAPAMQQAEAAEASDAPTRLIALAPDATLEARPLLGRDDAQARALAAIAQAFGERQPRLLRFVGPARSGKTRMLRRVSELAAQAVPDVSVAYGACDGRDEGPHAPFSRILLERFGITPASGPSTVRSEMLETVSEVLGSAKADRAAETTHLLGHVAGVPFPDSPFLERAEREPAALIEGAAAAIARFIEGEARRRPQLLLLDDFERADDPAWAIVSALLQLDAPVLLVATGSEALAAHKAGDAAQLDRSDLTPLSETNIAALVEGAYPSLAEVPAALCEALLARSGGRPGELLSVLRIMQNSGVLVDGEGGMTVDLERLAAGDLPLTAAERQRGTLAALPEAELSLMRDAAVIGEHFWDGALLALQRSRGDLPSPVLPPLEVWGLGEDSHRLDASLRSLEAKRLIGRLDRSARPGMDEFGFEDAQLREVLYGEIDAAERARCHGVVARWMAVHSGLAFEGIAALIAPHLERSGARDAAAAAYLQAAHDERQRMRTTMALRFTDRALALTGESDTTRRVEALHLRGALLTVLGRYDDAYQVFVEILRVSWSLGARSMGGAALNRLARIHRQRGEHDEALSHLRASLPLFRATGDLRGVASSYDDMAQVHRLRGDLEPALSAAKEALDIRVRSRDRRGQSVSLNTIGYIELSRGRYDAAESRFSTALKIRRALGDHEGAVQTEIALGRLAFERGQVEQALELYRRALEAAREMDNQRFQSYLHNHIAEALLACGELDAAQRSLAEAQALSSRLRDQRVQLHIERNLGLLALHRGEADAESRLERALRMAVEHGSPEAVALAHRCLARLRARAASPTAGGADLAEHEFRECIRVFSTCGNRPEVARAQAELGYHLRDRGDAPAARDALEEASTLMLELRLPELDGVRAALAEL